MRRCLYLLPLSAVLTLGACTTSKTARQGTGSIGSGSDAAPNITGSTNVSQEYYDNARRTVPPSFVLAVSTDSAYGVTQKKPICVGGATTNGARNQQRYLNALRGPKGEEISYRRRGSCCAFKTPNGLMGGMGLLDVYELTWAGQEKPMLLYLNFYDEGPLRAPIGLSVVQP